MIKLFYVPGVVGYTLHQITLIKFLRIVLFVTVYLTHHLIVFLILILSASLKGLV